MTDVFFDISMQVYIQVKSLLLQNQESIFLQNFKTFRFRSLFTWLYIKNY